MPEINQEDHPVGYDLQLSTGVKVDVKCRGGALPFKEKYESDDGLDREAKHNLFARQVYDDSLDADIYLMTHLETPKMRALPGTARQKKWILYICGWVSKQRVKREGVYLPRGSLTEQGRTWFTYRGQEIEYYNKNLNGIQTIHELSTIEPSDVEADVRKEGALNLTSVDAVRIAYDLVGRGVLSKEQLPGIVRNLVHDATVKPILHANQYFHLLRWLKIQGSVTDEALARAREILKEEPFEGL